MMYESGHSAVSALFKQHLLNSDRSQGIAESMSFMPNKSLLSLLAYLWGTTRKMAGSQEGFRQYQEHPSNNICHNIGL